MWNEPRSREGVIVGKFDGIGRWVVSDDPSIVNLSEVGGNGCRCELLRVARFNRGGECMKDI